MEESEKEQALDNWAVWFISKIEKNIQFKPPEMTIWRFCIEVMQEFDRNFPDYDEQLQKRLEDCSVSSSI